MASFSNPGRNAANQIDHYRLDELIFDSGTSAVFKGTDLESGRRVALKVPHLEAESDLAFFERFQREAAIGRELDHPGVLKVFPPEGQTAMYMAMEWVEGQSLRHLITREGKLPVERALEMALAICEALEYIHGRGVVHRDLKPENIVICSHGGIKVIDFGIASKADARRLTFGKLSRVMGTADYISPEQVKGSRGDARSDIFALGVVLYEMLTGKTPFRGTNPLAIMNDRLLNDPIPLREANPDLSIELEAIVTRALERDPAARYGSVRDFAHDLRHPDRVEAVSREAPARRDSLWKRMRFLCGIGLIPAAVLALLLYVARHQ